MAKSKKVKVTKKDALMHIEPEVTFKTGKVGPSAAISSIATRARSKRSSDEANLNLSGPTTKTARADKPTAKSPRKEISDKNNNATTGLVGVGPIVGSTKSLIDSIKGRKGKQKVNLPESPEAGCSGYSARGKSPAKSGRRYDPEEVYDDNMSEGLSLNPSGDEYTDDQGAEGGSSSSSESEDEQGGQSDPSSESEDSESEGTELHREVRHAEKPLRVDDFDRKQLSELRKDPQVKKLLDIMLKEEKSERRSTYDSGRGSRRRSRSRRTERGSSRRKRSRTYSRSRSRSRSRRHSKRRRRYSTDRDSSTDGNYGMKRIGNPKSAKYRLGTKLKSPSDATLYAPALKKVPTVASSPTLKNLNLSGQKSLIEQLSDLVGKVRVNERDHRSQTPSRHRSSREGTVQPAEGQVARVNVRPEVAEGNAAADNLITEAERFKATIQPPKGEINLSEFLRSIMENDDDDFFHLTCHIEAGLKTKIQKGEFVDLDRLLPKTRTEIMGHEGALQQFVNKNGTTYWAPPERDSRITNVRRWEQAFRVYAAIYCKANPTRSSEIWQYVYVINTAAVSYAWENVYFYDFTFRQLMAERPSRSWGKTYTQLWNLAMCDHLPKNNSFSMHKENGQGHFNASGTSAGQSSSGGTQSTSWRDRCCWRYNKGSKCRKWSCRYDHRCSNCGSWSHNKQNCSKASGGNGNKGRSRSRSPKRKQRK